MIRLTRLNRQPITVNADWIGSIEPTPDTMLRLITGESLLVRESVEEVVELVIDFRARVLAGAGLSGLVAPSSTPSAALLDALRRAVADPDLAPAPLPHP